MIKVYLYKGGHVYVNPAEILYIQEAGASSAWHGIRSFVKMSNGTTFDSTESPDTIYGKIE